MDEIQTNTLRENRVKIVNDLEPKGKVLDKLCEDGILTDNDIELVASASTRKERCQLLLSILPTRGPEAYGSFQKALEFGQYSFLAYTLGAETIESRENTAERTAQNKRCVNCTSFITDITSEDSPLNDLIWRILKRHCCLLLDNIEPKDLIDQLFQDYVITADDIDTIMASTTRRKRCENLFQILLHTEMEAVGESLKTSLMKKYSYIVENIKNEFDNTKLKDHDICAKPNADNESVRLGVARRSEILDKSRRLELLDKSYSCTNESEINVATLRSSALEKYQEKNVKELEPEGENHTDDGKQIREILADKLDDTVAVAPSKQFLTESHINRNRKDKGNDRLSHSKRYNTCVSRSHGEAEVLVKCKSTKTERSKRKLRLKELKVQVVDNFEIGNARSESDKSVENKEIVPMHMTAIQSQKPSRRLTMAFNYLSTLINQGYFTKFEVISSKLQTRFPSDFDLMFILGYLQTSRDLYQTDYDSAKSRIDQTMALLPRTSNPRYFMLELFTAKMRMYVTRKKFEKLQTSIDEAMMILETDPIGCTGRAAGWLYINDARNKTAQLSCLNLRSPNACHVYERLHEGAKSSFWKAMTNFKRDGGKDGPFGFCFALCRLVILLLRCGDNGLTMETLAPPADDIRSAGQYIHYLEDSDIEISKILEMHVRLANCDYQFRRGNIVRALEHAQIAQGLVTELRLLEFKEHAYNRVSFLKFKSPLLHVSDEILEEDVHRIIFEETFSSDCVTQNEHD